ncbi:hypothetical protein GCM10022419_071500 [Nonomuraea rosea]|uniref:Leucine-rich repeat domain-containing protein n=2 Tax=Nonomuraea rosea TaxID=638574 RepID=A0ABP6YA25_9ACTN
MAGKIAAGAPAGWRRAELRGYAGGHGTSGHRGLTYAPDDAGADVDVHEELCALHTLLGAGEHLTVELTVEARGRFEAVFSQSLERDDEEGFRYVLDRNARPAEPARDPADDPEAFGELTVSGPDALSMRGLHRGIAYLTVTNAPLVDFRPVSRAPGLWHVKVHNCPGADLAPLAGTSVELLDLGMDMIDLAPLAGHPTLRLLSLRTGQPVDLEPLLSCPRLYALDLSEAVIRDARLLGRLKSLLYLRLRRAQWEELWGLTDHPAGLAVAALAAEPRREKTWWWSSDRAYHAPEPSLKTAVRWAGGLAREHSDVRIHSGRYAKRRR